MKDQYFGDFGDYQKVSLLQELENKNLKVLVHWLKTKDDGSSDGKHITYLDKPELWRSFAPDIFDYLKMKLNSEKRSLSHIEQSPYTTKVEFISEYIEEKDKREEIVQKIIKSDADVIFFDPDNGIEVASTNKTNIQKYVIWEEITPVFAAGKSIIIYQHFSRSNRQQFIQNKVNEIHTRTSCLVVSVQVRHSVYFFLIQEKHENSLRKAIAEFSNTWKDLAIVR